MATIIWTWVKLSGGCLVQFKHQKPLVSVKIVSGRSWIHKMSTFMDQSWNKSTFTWFSVTFRKRLWEHTQSLRVDSASMWWHQPVVTDINKKENTSVHIRFITMTSQAAREEMWHSVSSRHLTQNWLQQISGVWPDSDASLRNDLQDQTMTTMVEKKILERSYSKTSDCCVSDSRTSQIISGDIYSVQMQSRKVTCAGSELTWRHTTWF